MVTSLVHFADIRYTQGIGSLQFLPNRHNRQIGDVHMPDYSKSFSGERGIRLFPARFDETYK